MTPGQIVAAYYCSRCDVAGRAPEDPSGRVPCWCCGQPATITARVGVTANAWPAVMPGVLYKRDQK